MILHGAMLISSVSGTAPRQLFCACLLVRGLRTISLRQYSILEQAKLMRRDLFVGYATGLNRRWVKTGKRGLSSLLKLSAFVRARSGQIQSLKSFMESILPPSGFLVQGSPGTSAESILTTIDLISSSSTISSPMKMELHWNSGKRSRILLWEPLKAPWLPRQKHQTQSSSCSTPRRRWMTWFMSRREILSSIPSDTLAGPPRHLAWTLTNRYLAGKLVIRPTSAARRNAPRLRLIAFQSSPKRKRSELLARRPLSSVRNGSGSMTNPRIKALRSLLLIPRLRQLRNSSFDRL